MNPLTVLLRSHIAAIIGVSDRTVSDYLLQSKPGGRYEHNPVPAPTGYLDATAPRGWVPPEQCRPGLKPFWAPELASAWRAWRDTVPIRRRAGAPPARRVA
ncbi:MAG: hypothetical protein ABWZ30_00940 [Jiangellaceae bacterium]